LTEREREQEIIMRALIIAAAASAALTLSACSPADVTEGDDANAVNLDANAMLANDMGGMDANLATNEATENMMLNDLTTNDADTNLANGL
jgi:hypothetical protein